MPTLSKAHKAALAIHECAKIAAAAGIDYPFAESEAVIAYRALNALAEKIRESATEKEKVRADRDAKAEIVARGVATL